MSPRRLRIHAALDNCVKHAQLETPHDCETLRQALHYALQRRKKGNEERLFVHHGNADAAMRWFECHALPAMKTAHTVSACNALSQPAPFLTRDCIVVDARGSAVPPHLLANLFTAAAVRQIAVHVVCDTDTPFSSVPITRIMWTAPACN